MLTSTKTYSNLDCLTRFITLAGKWLKANSLLLFSSHFLHLRNPVKFHNRVTLFCFLIRIFIRQCLKRSSLDWKNKEKSQKSQPMQEVLAEIRTGYFQKRSLMVCTQLLNSVYSIVLHDFTYKNTTKCRCPVGSSSASCSGSTGFEYRTGSRLSWLRRFVCYISQYSTSK
jgi:hypothetical protein